jgi:hypothetical protein
MPRALIGKSNGYGFGPRMNVIDRRRRLLDFSLTLRQEQGR